MATKFRFLLDGVERKPDNAGEILINFEQFTEAGALDLRKTLSDELLFTGENYEYIISDTNLCKRYVFEWQKFINGAYVEIFRGYFTRLNCTFNTNKPRCEVRADVQPLDEYSCLLEKWEKDINIEQYKIDTLIKIQSNFNLSFDVRCTDVDLPDYGEYVEHVEKPDFTPSIGDFPVIYYVFCREERVVDCFNGVPQPPSGPDWNLLQDDCATNGTATYWRRFDYTGAYTFQNDATGEYYIQDLGVAPPDPPPSPPGDWIPIADNNDIVCDYSGGTLGNVIVWFDRDFFEEVRNLANFFYVKGDRELTTTLDSMLKESCGPTAQFLSDFLTINPNYVTGVNECYASLSLLTISDVANGQLDINDASLVSMATRSNVSLNQLLADLSTLLNCRWQKRGDDIRFEHVTYFTKSVGIDLTILQNGRWAKNKNTFSYAIEDIPRLEKYNFSDQPTGRDFEGLPIDYESCGSSSIEYSIQRISTEVTSVLNNEEKRGSDNFLLVCTAALTSTSLFAEDGFLTGSFQSNAPLALANLHDRFFRDERKLPTGLLNGQPTTFNSIEPIIEQIDIDFPLCDPNDLKAEETIKTGLGEGDIQSATYNPRTAMIRAKLRFNE